MAVPDDKTTLHIVVDKEIKEKLQTLADRDDRKLSNFVSRILDNYIVEYENKLLNKHGFEDFYKYFYHIFDHAINPHKVTQVHLIIDRTMDEAEASDIGLKVDLDELLNDVDIEQAKKQIAKMERETGDILNGKFENSIGRGRIVPKPNTIFSQDKVTESSVEYNVTKKDDNAGK